jgi:hypothetical protein
MISLTAKHQSALTHATEQMQWYNKPGNVKSLTDVHRLSAIACAASASASIADAQPDNL